MVEGLLLVHKPAGPTSHDVVQIVRRKLSERRIGHTGTLDPAAQGLLILLVGAATASQRAFQHQHKVYEATMQLGVQTDTGDAAGQSIRTAPVPVLDQRRIAEVLAAFRGPVSQTPPAYSAVKVRGHPAYWWARRHQPVTLSARVVHIAAITLVDWNAQAVTFRVECSAGTYVRVLAESIAERLGTVGHVAQLTRLRIGDWSLDQAKPLAWIVDASPAELIAHLQPVASPA